MDIDYIIATRSMFPRLTKKCHSLLKEIPCKREKIKHTGSGGKGATDYLNRIFKINKADWVINIDEDAFVFDIERMLNLMKYMKENGYHICGMPDGGVIPARIGNPIVMNPFFNIIDTRFTRKIDNFDIVFEDWMKDSCATHLMKSDYSYDKYLEKYYDMSFALLKNKAKILYLNAEMADFRSEDERDITTILKDHEDVPFLIHSWYARKYHRPFTKKRINRDYEKAKEMKEKG